MNHEVMMKWLSVLAVMVFSMALGDWVFGRIIPALVYEGSLPPVGGLLPYLALFFANAVAVFSACSLLLFGWVLRSRAPALALFLVVFAVLLLIAPFFRPGAMGQTFLAILTAVLLLVNFFTMWKISGLPVKEKVVLASFTAQFLIAYHYVFGATVWQSFGATTAPLTTPAIGTAETLSVLNGILAFWAWAPPWREIQRPALYSALAIVLVGALLVAREGVSATTAVLWAVGNTLFLPWVVYALSLFFFLVTVVSALLSPQQRLLGAALLLIFLAGLTPLATYDLLLAVLGLGLAGFRRVVLLPRPEAPAVS
jgi:hypothetical protein